MKKNATLILTYSLTGLFAIFLLLGCSQTTTTHSTLNNLASEVDLIKIVKERLENINEFQGDGKLKISNSQKSESATGVITIKKPNMIRLESFSFLGQSVFFFASNGEEFSIFIPKENKFFTGKDTLENAQKVLPLDVTIEEFSRYLLGELKVGADDNIVVKTLEDQNIYKLYFYGAEKKVIWFDPEFSVITRCETFDADDELKSVVTYSKFKDVDGMMFPNLISISFPYLDAKIEVSYDNVAFNEKVNDELFTLVAPEGSTIVNLDSKEAL